VDSLANGEYLNYERVLNEQVKDVFTYLVYTNQKAMAEEAQYKFQESINKNRK
jgi:hypothetical protein